jgi:hypothetical protein
MASRIHDHPFRSSGSVIASPTPDILLHCNDISYSMADPLPQTDSMQKSLVAVAATLVQQHGNGADNATRNTAEGMSQVNSSSNATVMDENFPAALN